MSAFSKIPLQIVVPLIGVLVFTFYVFTPAPLLFNGVHDARVRASARAGDYAAVEQQSAGGRGAEGGGRGLRAASDAATRRRIRGAHGVRGE